MALKSITYIKNEKDKLQFDISYSIVNPSKEKTLLFLHGWGSNKELMEQSFKNTFKEYKHIYVDMPGFGKSSNKYVLTTFDYANIIKLFLDTLGISYDDLSIAGHSFGGKVATLLNPKLLILLSSAGIVEEKSFSVRTKIKLAKMMNIFGLGSFSKLFRSKDVEKMSQNMYETFKNVVDEDFTEYFKSFENRALLFWGEKDKATSLASGQKIKDLIKNSEFYSYDSDHYFFMKFAEEISKKVQYCSSPQI